MAEPPIISLADGVEDALTLLEMAREQAGGVRSADGELYELPPELDATIASDPWRARLTRWALRAIESPDEAWLFRGGEPTEEPIEHRPHILVARAHGGAPARAIEVGTRRVNGRMRIQTWYQVVHPLIHQWLPRVRARSHVGWRPPPVRGWPGRDPLPA